jgi:hypothetical protein
MAKIKWAVDLFQHWQLNRNEVAETRCSNLSPIRVKLENMSVDELNFCISRFLCEAKKVDGTDYPADTVHSLVICLQLFMDTRGQQYKFLSDPLFQQIRNTLDNVMKERTRNHVGGPKKQAQIITTEEESSLWECGTLGSDTPDKLLHTMLYLIGLNFALRGGEEHRNLRAGPSSQISVAEDEHGRHLVYREDVSKTMQGGLKHRKVEGKRVLAYANTQNPERCIVRLYETYMLHCPQFPRQTDAFYLKPLAKASGDVWYAKQCVGRHKLASVVADICRKGGLSGFRTNHSLRSTSATRMYDAGIDEQLICEITGHRSNAVRNYKRTNTAQKRKISGIIQQDAQPRSRQPAYTCTRSNDNANVSVTVNVSFPSEGPTTPQ